MKKKLTENAPPHLQTTENVMTSGAAATQFWLQVHSYQLQRSINNNFKKLSLVTQLAN